MVRSERIAAVQAKALAALLSWLQIRGDKIRAKGRVERFPALIAAALAVRRVGKKSASARLEAGPPVTPRFRRRGGINVRLCREKIVRELKAALSAGFIFVLVSPFYHAPDHLGKVNRAASCRPLAYLTF
ncbi:hypothetical protein ACFO5K_13450 [Nocardia halotolerans]|uniref:Transposase n=1 Tax=Nocardia halotolerans TaxID=1755878 RepID=A0ABV8VGE6_9NOCA